MKLNKKQKKALIKLHNALIKAEETKLIDELAKETIRCLIDRFCEIVTEVKQKVVDHE